MSTLPFRALAATIALLILGLVPTAIPDVGPASASTSSTAGTRPLVTIDRPEVTRGPGYRHAPNLAAARLGSTVRLFKTINQRARDNNDLRNLRKTTTFADVRPDGSHGPWQSVVMGGSTGFQASVQNFAQVGRALFNVDSMATAGGPSGTTMALVDGKWERVPTYTAFATSVRTSVDGGRHFDQQRATIWLDRPVTTPRVFPYQGIVQLTSHEWIMPVYAGGRVWLAASRDHGKTWRAGTPPYNGGANYTEATVARRPDGRLVMVARADIYLNQKDRRYAKAGVLVFRISNGPVRNLADLSRVTWTKPQVTIPGSPALGGVRTKGASPKLIRAGRYLVLAYGRPGNHLSFSTDGLRWSATTASGRYGNRPSYPNGCRDSAATIPCDAVGSNGYMGIVATDPDYDRVGSFPEGFVAYDSCGPWSCGATNYPVPGGHGPFPLGTGQRITLEHWRLNYH